MSGQINISTPAKTYITDRHRLRIHPLPPPIIGHLTGLTCPECPLNSTSQLRYHPPRFPNPANINWKCHEPDSNHRNGKSYIRTLQLEHLINNIRAVNTGAQPPPPPGSLSSLLNRSNKAPDHIKIKSTGNLCPGYLGQTGATHHSSIKSNMKCSHKLCISCCQMGQRMHHLTCKFKAHRYAPSSLGTSSVTSPVITSSVPFSPSSALIPGYSVSEQLQIPQPSGSSSHKPIQSAQANRTVTSTLTPSQLLEYHQNLQAVELLANSRQAAKSVAVRTILIELWTKVFVSFGNLNSYRFIDELTVAQAGSSTMIHAEAPHWPLSSLQESQIVLDQFRKASSDTGDWESEIHVWNMDQFRWISLAPTCTLTYPLIPRKLLVRLERVSDDDCTGLQDAILKMTAEGPYEPLTTPARCILANLPSSGLTHTHTVQDKHKTPESFPLPSPSKVNSKNSDIEWIGSSLETKVGPEDPLMKGRSTSKWPDSRVLLHQIMRWHLSSKSECNLQDPWCKIFGDMYDYGHTTVYRVRKWILLVGTEQLELLLHDYPSMTLIEARKMYFQEWLDTKNGGGKDKNQHKRKSAGQRVEVAKPKRPKVDHGQVLFAVPSTEDLDVGIVGH
ncbi:hypothetical protein MJO28_010627 [Puccinia striiformis f. sp. tritici]|uniref:Uncharacterized protein n=3 Tax=Puccinia striiformis TaxID=27350 RepID=A0A2S4VDE1_9BASI|nr:hypothetical protein MJO28_010627 [Puccinia striiformis f. sp. tritici]POW07517.1 hypothetical protein PSHT_09901 [Puccinia striiformis]